MNTILLLIGWLAGVAFILAFLNVAKGDDDDYPDM